MFLICIIFISWEKYDSKIWFQPIIVKVITFPAAYYLCISVYWRLRSRYSKYERVVFTIKLHVWRVQCYYLHIYLPVYYWLKLKFSKTNYLGGCILEGVAKLCGPNVSKVQIRPWLHTSFQWWWMTLSNAFYT